MLGSYQLPQLENIETEQNEDTAKAVYEADDKREAVGSLVPEGYKGSYQAAVASYDKAVEIKHQKDEMQIAMFEKVIDPLWRKYDENDDGYITQEQFMELGKTALENAGHGDKFNEEAFKLACSQMIEKDEANPEGRLKKRTAAEMLNTIVFGGL